MCKFYNIMMNANIDVWSYRFVYILYFRLCANKLIEVYYMYTQIYRGYTDYYLRGMCLGEICFQNFGNWKIAFAEANKHLVHNTVIYNTVISAFSGRSLRIIIIIHIRRLLYTRNELFTTQRKIVIWRRFISTAGIVFH